VSVERTATMVCPEVYPTWQAFFTTFLREGGVIEACIDAGGRILGTAGTNSTSTSLTLDLLMSPEGKGDYELLSAADQVMSAPFKTWGWTYPQLSVPQDKIKEICDKLARACTEQSIIGHVCVDLVSFIDPETKKQQVWATGLKLQYSTSLALSKLLGFVTVGGSLDPDTGGFHLKGVAKRRRYAIASTQLLHTNLSIVHYSVFFNMCRASGITLNVKQKSGAVFTLMDSFTKGRIGMCCVGATLSQALMMYCHNLTIIHKALSSPSMQGINNFGLVDKQLKLILEVIARNGGEDQSDLEPSDLAIITELEAKYRKGLSSKFS